MPESPSPTHRSIAPLAGVLERNIATLVRRRQSEENAKPAADRIADAVTRFTGSMACVYVHLVFVGLWIVLNLPGVPFPKFDPTYVTLAMCASVEALFLSTFLLISQNRTAALAEKRNELNLQISLLAEHEVTRLMKLVTAIAQELKIEAAKDPELEELKRDVAAEKVLDTIEQAERPSGEAAGVASKTPVPG